MKRSWLTPLMGAKLAASSASALPLREGRNRQGRFRGGVAAVPRSRGRENRLADTFEVGKNLAVRETQNQKSLPSQPFVANFIPDCVGVTRMLAAVDFDDQSSFGAEEIDNVSAKRSLATKPKSLKGSTAQELPQVEFSGGERPTHDFSEPLVLRRNDLMGHSFVSAAVTPPRNRFAVSALPQGEGWGPTLAAWMWVLPDVEFPP